MNALNFLKHKSEVVFIYEDYSVKRAMDEFQVSGYTALPILSRDGRYVGSITEGDFLRFLLHYDLIDMSETEQPSDYGRCAYGGSDGNGHEPKFCTDG